MKRIIIILVLILLVPSVKVRALSCSYNELARLKKIASNVNISYDYVEQDNNVTFTVTLNNLNKEIYFVDMTNYRTYNYENDEITISGYRSGQTVKYVFYSVNSRCEQEALYTARVSFPSYNQYYKDQVCEGIENFSLCQKWSSQNLSYESFLNKVNEYKNSLEVDDNVETPPTVNETPWVQLIVDFLLDYYIIIVIILALGLVGLYFLSKKDNVYS